MKNSTAPLITTEAIVPAIIEEAFTKKYGINGMIDPNIVDESTTAKLQRASFSSTGASFSSKAIMNSSIALGFEAM